MENTKRIVCANCAEIEEHGHYCEYCDQWACTFCIEESAVGYVCALCSEGLSLLSL